MQAYIYVIYLIQKFPKPASQTDTEQPRSWKCKYDCLVPNLKSETLGVGPSNGFLTSLPMNDLVSKPCTPK